MSTVAAPEVRPSWSHFYGAELTWGAHLSNVFHHLPFLATIRSLRPRSLVEVGAGSGSTSIFLSYFVPRVVSIDLDEEIVRSCQRTAPRFFGRAEYRRADAFDLSDIRDREFDLCVSQGFFEHFGDAQIRELLNVQLRVARQVAFSVPNAAYGRQDFGDERLLTRPQWDDLLRELGFDVVESRDYAPIHAGGVWRRPVTALLWLARKAGSNTRRPRQGGLKEGTAPARTRGADSLRGLRERLTFPRSMYAAVVSSHR